MDQIRKLLVMNQQGITFVPYITDLGTKISEKRLLNQKLEHGIKEPVKVEKCHRVRMLEIVKGSGIKIGIL